MRILFISFVLFFSVTVNAETIKIGYFQLAPYVFKDDETGRIKGAVYDFIKNKIEPVMGVRFDWIIEPYPIPRLVKQLEMGDVDAAAVFAKNSEREKKFAYPDKPYFISHPTLVVRKDRNIKKINSISDLYNIRIGYCKKSYISPFMRDKNIKWDLLFSSTCIEQNLKRVFAGRIDAQYQPSEVELLYYAIRYGVESEIKLVQLPEEVKLYVPFSKGAAKRYLKSFNNAMEKSGGVEAFKKHLSKYIDISKL